MTPAQLIATLPATVGASWSMTLVIVNAFLTRQPFSVGVDQHHGIWIVHVSFEHEGQVLGGSRGFALQQDAEQVADDVVTWSMTNGGAAVVGEA